MSWWSWLPTLPSIDLTLPSGIQKRFISFALRQTLGRFLKPGQLEIQQVDSQIGSGYVQIRDVELDNTAINALISGLPLQLHDGSVGNVTARIPLPNPLTSSVGLSLESLHLTFYIVPDVSGPPFLDSTNLAESVASVADAFIHEELSGPDEASLRESFYSELSESTSSLPDYLPGSLDPFSSDEASRGEGEPSGVSLFATLVERLLARFAFDATDTKITVVYPQHASFTLSISEIRYGTDVSNPASLEGVARSVSISGVSVTTRLLLPPTPQPRSSGSSQDAPTIHIPSGRTSPDRPPPASPLSDSSEMDEDTQMFMSQSIVSLPPRPISPTNSVSSSMYESAISASPSEEGDHTEDPPCPLTPPPSSPPPIECSSEPQPFQKSPSVKPVLRMDLDDLEDELILSFGTEPIVIRALMPSLPRPDPGPQTSASTTSFPQHPDAKGKQKAQSPPSGSSTLHLSVRVPVIACALRAQNIRSLIDVANAFTSHSPSVKKEPPAETSKSTTSLFDHTEGDVQIRGVVVILHPQIPTNELEGFFKHPLVPPRLRRGYVRVLTEGWNASFSLQNEPVRRSMISHQTSNTQHLTASFSLSDFSIFAFLRPDPWDSRSKLHASPILITDPYLGTQYSTSHIHPDLGPWNHQSTLPVFDVIDWTDPVHRPESTKLSHWRTRPHQSRPTPRSGSTQRREGPSSSSPRFNPVKSASPRSPKFSPPSSTPKTASDPLSRPRSSAVSAKLTSISSSRTTSRSKRNSSASSLQVDVKLAPLHVFVDAALCLEGDTPGSVSELLAFASDLAPLKPELPEDGSDNEGSDVGEAGDLEEGPGTPRAGTPFKFEHHEHEQERERRRLERLVLDDLDLGFDYTQETPRKKRPEPNSPTHSRSHRKDRSSKQVTSISIEIPSFRLQVRGSSKFSDARSGAVVVDIHDLRIFPGGESTRELGTDDPSVRFTSETPFLTSSDTSDTLVACTWQRLLVAYCPAREYKAVALVSVGPFSVQEPTQGGIPIDGPAHPKRGQKPSPRLVVSQTSSAMSSINTKLSRMAVALEIPSVHCELSKSAFDGLQLWADALSRLAERAFNPTTKSRDDGDSGASSILGSRYFAKGTSQSSGLNTPSTITVTRRPQSPASSETVVKLTVSEVVVRLLVPRSDDSTSIRPFDVVASDLDILLEIKPEGKDETVISVDLSELTVLDHIANGSTFKLLGLTVPRHLTTRIRSLLRLRFTSLVVTGTTAKESKVKVTLCGVTYTFTPNLDWIQELSKFAKAPPGVFDSVVPSERTHVTLKLVDTSIKLLAPVYPGSVLVYVGETEFSTVIVGGAQDSSFHLAIHTLSLLLIDDVNSVPRDDGDNISNASGVTLWKNEGYALLAEIGDFDLRFQRDDSLSPSDVRVSIHKGSLRMHMCADTMTALTAFIPDFISIFASNSEPPPKVERKEPTAVSEPTRSRRGIMASLDEDAFRRAPEVGPAPDMIYDDLPTNLEYLDESFSASAGLRELPDDDSDDDFQYHNSAPSNVDGVVSQHGGETIRMFQPELGTVEHFFDTLPPESEDEGLQYGDTTLKVRIQSCDVTLFLYDGYDWARTRRIIEDEAKDMRRKLAKIRQLVANGQTPDPSVEETNTLLFNSVYIGLEHNLDELEPVALIAAIDDELNEDSETSSQSSWQSFKPQSPSHKHSSSRSTSIRRKTLNRAKSPSIEFRLLGLDAEIDNYRSHPELAARTLIEVRDIEILDHIKTSTWKKFLTDLRTDSKGNIRETDSNMARVELRKVYPVPGHESQEARLRAKLLPLRLHVDQDALDFLKKFFSFKDPDSAPAEPSDPADEIFFQQAEVFPVDLKLDYKPRRVDYRALREGKTIELMNFFHFDGAEMTLRRIVLRGITGWARFFDLLNDIWTPDVKATQLVDVISGVAPIRSVVNVGSGVADLVLLPIAQYRKDGRVVRGLQKGTTAFVKSTATEAIKLGARLATGTQVILEQAETVLGGQFKDSVTTEALQVNTLESEGIDIDPETRDLISRYANQPMNVTEGVQSAYQSLTRNLNSAAQTILAVPMEVYERSGSEGTVRAVIRAVPIAVLRPMIGASEAIGKTLQGFHNTLDPSVRLENEAKYK